MAAGWTDDNFDVLLYQVSRSKSSAFAVTSPTNVCDAVIQPLYEPKHGDALLITPLRLVELCDRSFCQSVILSFCLSVSRITHERVNGRRPNTVGMDKG